jgi:hypothetical protein
MNNEVVRSENTVTDKFVLETHHPWQEPLETCFIQNSLDQDYGITYGESCPAPGTRRGHQSALIVVTTRYVSALPFMAEPYKQMDDFSCPHPLYLTCYRLAMDIGLGSSLTQTIFI